MQIVKLGGSLITAKRSTAKKGGKPQQIFRAATADRVVSELKSIPMPLVLVHGAGSFGHVKAHQYGLHKGFNKTPRQVQGAAEVSRDVRVLNMKVLEVLANNKLSCISIPPAVSVENKNGVIKKIDTDIFKKYLKQGLIPVSFGDLVHDSVSGISICSGDDIMYELSKTFLPKRAVFVCDEDGVFDKNPRKHKDAELITYMTKKQLTRIIKEHGEEEGLIDVTGGMLRKAEMCFEISKLGVECIILNGLKKGNLSKALKGKNVVGTYF